MLPKPLWDLLLSHKIYVLALGDPGQLPPIGEGNGALDKPHIFLDEIMRQSQESEIIRLTLAIREGKVLTPYQGNEVQIINQKDVVSGMYLWADQILAGKNITRRNINHLVRQYKYGVDVPDFPVEDDKLICLRNYWDLLNECGDVLVNGSMGYLNNINISNHPILGKDLIFDFIPDYCINEDYDSAPFDFVFRKIDADYGLITTGEPFNNNNMRRRFMPPKQFDYGYCITTHKSQGSEYDKVLVFEECLRKDEHSKWLYTAATRAKNKLVIVKSN